MTYHALMVERGGTHWRLLLSAILNTKGPVLELGCGWASTPLLHVTARGRRLLTVDHDRAWLDRFAELGSGTHGFYWAGDWAAPHSFYDEAWDVALVDQAPNEARIEAVDRLRPRVRCFVLHDSQEEFFGPHLDRWAFAYSVRDQAEPATMLLSDREDVRAWSGRAFGCL